MSLTHIISLIQSNDAPVINLLVDEVLQLPEVKAKVGKIPTYLLRDSGKEIERSVHRLLEELGSLIPEKLKKKLILEAKIWKEHREEKIEFLLLMQRVKRSSKSSLFNKLTYNEFKMVVEYYYPVLGDFIHDYNFSLEEINMNKAGKQLVKILKDFGVKEEDLQIFPLVQQLDTPAYEKKNFRVFYRVFLRMYLSKVSSTDFLDANFLGENLYSIPVNQKNFPPLIYNQIMNHAISIPLENFEGYSGVPFTAYDASFDGEELILDYEVEKWPKKARLLDAVKLFIDHEDGWIDGWMSGDDEYLTGFSGAAQQEFSEFAKTYGLFEEDTNDPIDSAEGLMMVFSLSGVKEIF